jgi:hypothetical protein
MTALLQWMTANPFRAFLAAGLAALLAMIALPMSAWLPAGLVVLAVLAAGEATAFAAVAGAAAVLVWAFAPMFGAGPALAIHSRRCCRRPGGVRPGAAAASPSCSRH